MSWELANRPNRSIDLTPWFDEKYVNFVIVEDAKYNDLLEPPKVVVHLGRDQTPNWLSTKSLTLIQPEVEQIGDLDESITSSIDWNNPEQRRKGLLQYQDEIDFGDDDVDDFLTGGKSPDGLRIGKPKSQKKNTGVKDLLRIDDIKFSSNEKTDIGRPKMKRGASPDIIRAVEVTIEDVEKISNKKRTP